MKKKEEEEEEELGEHRERGTASHLHVNVMSFHANLTQRAVMLNLYPCIQFFLLYAFLFIQNIRLKKKYISITVFT